MPQATVKAAGALLALALAGACADKVPPIDSYCPKKAAERLDFTDPGLYGLSPPNKRAVLLGEDTYLRDCTGAGRKPGGPR